jgi:tetratricopeptide (TPR) repeat protein
VPQVKAAFDFRKSIAETLSATINSSGIDHAMEQYRDLKASKDTTYNFDEEQLNGLGYRLLRAHKLSEAIRIFRLNIEIYPQSGNVYDSLAEAYLQAGDKSQAIANCQKSLELNPNNANAKVMLEKLGRP